jgi:hypothetical protein
MDGEMEFQINAMRVPLSEMILAHSFLQLSMSAQSLLMAALVRTVFTGTGVGEGAMEVLAKAALTDLVMMVSDMETRAGLVSSPLLVVVEGAVRSIGVHGSRG